MLNIGDNMITNTINMDLRKLFLVLLSHNFIGGQVVDDVQSGAAVQGENVIFPWTYSFSSGSLIDIKWIFDPDDGTPIKNILKYEPGKPYEYHPAYVNRVRHINDSDSSAKLELSQIETGDLGLYNADVFYGGVSAIDQASITDIIQRSQIDKSSVTCETESFTDDTEKAVESSCTTFTVKPNLPSGWTHPYNVTFTNGDVVSTIPCTTDTCTPMFTASYTAPGNTVHILLEHLLLTPNVTYEFRAKYRAATTTDSPDTNTTQPIPTTDDKEPSPGPTQPPVTSDSPTEAPTPKAPRLSPPWWAWLVLALGLLLLVVLIVVGCMCCEGCPGYKRRQRKQMKRGVYIDERVPPQHDQPYGQPYGQPHGQTAGQPQGYPPGYPSGQPHGYNHSNGRGVSVHRDPRQDELSMQPRGQPSVVTVKTNDQRPAPAKAYSNQGFTPEPAPDYGDGTARITVSGRY